jgi:hypothetical protein
MLEGADLSDYAWCNTNNHRDTEAYHQMAGPHFSAWYRERIEETRMDKWASTLGDLCGDRLVRSRVFIITPCQQRQFFQPAAVLASKGVRASRLMREEAEELAAELGLASEEAFVAPPSGWFVRTSACSPKDAMHDGGAGPHDSLTSVLLALFASERIHKSIKDYCNDMTVYLMPFDVAVNIQRELRVFVCEGSVSAISQYDIFNFSIFSHMSNEDLAGIAQKIDAFHRNEVAPRWSDAGGISSYVMDVEYIASDASKPEEQVRLIELNCFGAELAAASALFHWVHDASELYSARSLCMRIRALE